MKKLQTERGMVQALMLHDLFRQLSGNRQSINLVAAFHRQGHDLSLMYKKIHNEEELIDETSSYGEGKIKPSQNLISLFTSTEASVKLLRDSYPLTEELLFFLGCLPEGIKDVHLKLLFDEQQVNEALDVMQGHNILENDQSVLRLSSYVMNKYVRKIMGPE